MYNSKVKPNIEKIRKWAAEGMNRADIARKLGINVSTFRDIVRRYESLSILFQDLRKWDTHVKPRLEEIKIWVSEGKSKVWICNELNISKSLYDTYRERYPEFIEVLELGTETMHSKLKCSMVNEALGYMVTEREFLKEKGKKLKSKRKNRWVRPSVEAMEFLLCNDFGYKRKDQQVINVEEVIIKDDL